uniref:Uncharacterized protein n=1 Tax=Anopheles dirus TaxID=7168 RepID=A0A182NVV6_9DIPT
MCPPDSDPSDTAADHLIDRACPLLLSSAAKHRVSITPLPPAHPNVPHSKVAHHANPKCGLKHLKHPGIITTGHAI